MQPSKVPFFGELVSADASTAAALTLYNANRATITAIGAGERLFIEDVLIVTESALTVDLFDDADGDGAVDAKERIAGGAFAANGGLSKSYKCPPCLAVGSVALKGKASGAGNIRIHVGGYIGQ